MHRIFWLASPFIVVVACAEPQPGPIAFQFCATQHDAGGLVVCDQAFETAPRVHLPADGSVYGAVGGKGFVGADGQVLLAFLPASPASNPPGFAMPSYEFVETVYRLDGNDVVPVVKLAPEVLDGNLLGTWEGTLSTRIDDDHYDQANRIAIRVTFDRFDSAHHDLHRWDPYDAADPIIGYRLATMGTIENTTTAVTLANGSCAPSLVSFGAGNPTTSPDLTLMREFAMHVPGDMSLLFEGWMGAIDHALPGALIATTPEASAYAAYPHGTPNGQHLADFTRVTAGGGTCAPF